MILAACQRNYYSRNYYLNQWKTSLSRNRANEAVP